MKKYLFVICAMLMAVVSVFAAGLVLEVHEAGEVFGVSEIVISV